MKLTMKNQGTDSKIQFF